MILCFILNEEEYSMSDEPNHFRQSWSPYMKANCHLIIPASLIELAKRIPNYALSTAEFLEGDDSEPDPVMYSINRAVFFEHCTNPQNFGQWELLIECLEPDRLPLGLVPLMLARLAKQGLPVEKKLDGMYCLLFKLASYGSFQTDSV